MTCHTCDDGYESVVQTDDLHIDYDPDDCGFPFAITKNDNGHRSWPNIDDADELADQLESLAEGLRDFDTGELPSTEIHDGQWLKAIDSNDNYAYFPASKAEIDGRSGRDSGSMEVAPSSGQYIRHAQDGGMDTTLDTYHWIAVGIETVDSDTVDDDVGDISSL